MREVVGRQREVTDARVLRHRPLASEFLFTKKYELCLLAVGFEL